MSSILYPALVIPVITALELNTESLLLLSAHSHPYITNFIPAFFQLPMCPMKVFKVNTVPKELSSCS